MRRTLRERGGIWRICRIPWWWRRAWWSNNPWSLLPLVSISCSSCFTMHSRESEMNRAAAAISWPPMMDEINIAGQRLLSKNCSVCQETLCCKHATEERWEFGSGGKHAGDCQAGPGAGVDELGLGQGQQHLLSPPWHFGHTGSVLVIHKCKQNKYAHILIYSNLNAFFLHLPFLTSILQIICVACGNLARKNCC